MFRMNTLASFSRTGLAPSVLKFNPHFSPYFLFCSDTASGLSQDISWNREWRLNGESTPPQNPPPESPKPLEEEPVPSQPPPPSH